MKSFSTEAARGKTNRPANGLAHSPTERWIRRGVPSGVAGQLASSMWRETFQNREGFKVLEENLEGRVFELKSLGLRDFGEFRPQADSGRVPGSARRRDAGAVPL